MHSVGVRAPAMHRRCSIVLAIGFIALAVWGATQHDWLVMALAIAMVPVTIAGCA